MGECVQNLSDVLDNLSKNHLSFKQKLNSIENQRLEFFGFKNYR